MLYHLTITHTEDNCPVYQKEKMPEVLAAFENLESLASELNLKQYYFVWCPPDHVAYALVEADSLAAVSRYIFSIPMPQKIEVKPVEHLSDTVEMAKRVAATQ